jgi:hypothetical protein
LVIGYWLLLIGGALSPSAQFTLSVVEGLRINSVEGLLVVGYWLFATNSRFPIPISLMFF